MPIFPTRWSLLPVTLSKDLQLKLEGIPAFSSVALKLLSLMGDDSCSLNSIASCISADPVLSGQLIKRANSADQSFYLEVRDVRQAAVILGLDRTREISIAAAASAYAGSAIKSDILRPCWHHSLACAITASHLARWWGLRVAECYAAGLFHEIGRLGLLAAYPAEYEQVISEGLSRRSEVKDREQEKFGIDHIVAGEWLARKWNLPASIGECITGYDQVPGALDQLAVIQIACRVASFLGFGISQDTDALQLEQVMEMLPDWSRQQFETEIENLRQNVSDEVGQFGTADVRDLPPLVPEPVAVIESHKPETDAIPEPPQPREKRIFSFLRRRREPRTVSCPGS